MLQMQHKVARYSANTSDWDSCHLLHDAFSNHKLLTDDVVNQTKSCLIDLGRYHDSFLALKEVLATHHVAGLLDEDLQKIVRVMHDRGTERLYRGETRQNIEKGKKFVVDYLVENHKVTRGDAQRVAKGWYDQVFTYHWR
jgi:hypothetical protein